MTEEQIWAAIGWLGQGFFFSRFLIQWLATERAGKITVPPIFWYFSLAGALFGGAYAAWEGNPVFLAGFAINLFIYGRNLWIMRTGRVLSGGALPAVGLGLVALATVNFLVDMKETGPPMWLMVGILGQVFWLSRFPLQWWYAERHGEATLPPHFFLVSLIGSTLLLGYAISLGNPIFIAGMALNPFLYSRQTWIAFKTREPEAPAGAPESAEDGSRSAASSESSGILSAVKKA